MAYGAAHAGVKTSRLSASQPPPQGMPLGVFEPLERTALSIVGREAAKWRDVLATGRDQPVDFVVWIKGLVHIGEPQTATIRKKPELVDVLAVLFARLRKQTRSNVAIDLVNHCTGKPPLPLTTKPARLPWTSSRPSRSRARRSGSAMHPGSSKSLGRLSLRSFVGGAGLK